MLLANTSLACRPAPSWVPPTIPEQVSFAGVIFKGVATKITGDENGYVVKFKDVVYYRGCGKTFVTVTGFKGSNLCGPQPPAVGESMFLFACVGNDWDLNNYTFTAGAVPWTTSDEALIENLTENELKCDNCATLFAQCKHRPN